MTYGSGKLYLRPQTLKTHDGPQPLRSWMSLLQDFSYQVEIRAAISGFNTG